MSEAEHQYGGGGGGGIWLLALTFVMVGALVFLMNRDSGGAENPTASSGSTGNGVVPSKEKEGGSKMLIVYCAAGVKQAVEEAAGKFTRETGVKVALEYASSGVLFNKLLQDHQAQRPRADVYVAADFSFAERARSEGLVAEALKVATWKVVLGVKPGSGLELKSAGDVLKERVSFVLCDPLAGVGKKTKKMLEKSGHWAGIDAAKGASFPTVTEAALAAKENAGTQAAFVWDSTARQFGLRVVELPELEASRADITASVTRTTEKATLSLQFVRFLSAPEKGGDVFESHHYTPMPGDAWAVRPKLRIDCGGVNREAVEKTIREFATREGCDIDVVYAGCGTLVSKMKTGDVGLPDLFMTCDATYLDKVQLDMGNPFGPDLKVSSTRIVMLVSKGNPEGLKKLADLARPGLRIGVTEPTASTLGMLCVELFREAGQYDAIKKNIDEVGVRTDTAHTLIQSMEAGGKLDVALVYEANIQHLRDRFDYVALQPARAMAIQNVAARKTTPYPQLADRLMAALTSGDSRRRFEQLGFSWKASAE